MLPISLEAATERMMRAGSVAREEGVLGDDFVDHFGGTRLHEVKLWNEAVTNWEGVCASHAFYTVADGRVCSGALFGVGLGVTRDNGIGCHHTCTTKSSRNYHRNASVFLTFVTMINAFVAS